MVIDTHVLIWHAEDNPKLSQLVKDEMDNHPERVIISAVLVWELMILAEKGRINTHGKSPEQYARGLLERTCFREVSLTNDVAILSRTLGFKHEDPADRFLAATALWMNMPLVTYDQKLIQLPWLRTIS